MSGFGSRLPAPTPTSKLGSRAATSSSATTTRTKRPVSPNPSALNGNAAKRPRPGGMGPRGPGHSTTMIDVPGEKFGSTFAPISGVTGRATNLYGSTRSGGVGSSATAPTRSSVAKTTSVRVGNTTTTGRLGITARAGSAARSGTAATGRVVNDENKVGAASTNAGGKPPKRAPWDLKGKLEDKLEEMDNRLKATQNRVSDLETEKKDLSTQVVHKDTVVQQNTEELESLKRQLDESRREKRECEDQAMRDKRDLNKQLEEERDKNKGHLRKIEDLDYTKSSLERKVQGLEGEIATKISEVNGLKTSVAEMGAASAGLEAKLSSTKSQLDDALSRNAQLDKTTKEQAEAIDTFKSKERGYETERRKLHNTIQELKGNIRVFCRVRPLLGAEVEQFGPTPRHLTYHNDKMLDITRAADSPHGTSTSVSGKAETFPFDFDHVFAPGTSQECVFEEVSQLVQSAIDGFNVCIFAYGQTGSGKTHTMEGGEEEGEEGIIPRTIAKIFEETRNLEEQGWHYKMEASFVEIYNEEIRDLLATEKGLKYDIKRVDTKSTEIYVSNLKIEEISCGDNVNPLLRRAKKNRAVAATNCNERSSRSHSVFILKIHGKNVKTSESCVGSLNLVDLAGSERLKASGSTGARLEETKSINSSLSNLSKVILALANSKDGSSHIPYRDSKLTHLLMNSLGGNSKTLMFVNLNPREEYFGESLNSLRFAKRVNQCQIGTAQKKVTDK